MALENGGLDAQVEQRMDTYRGNPQKLQQRYGQNKELLDLMALQKLTAEKKQIAADMQLKQQQQPGTIAQQREQEALGLVKQEMGGTLGDLAGRTKDTLGQKQALQKKNMQRLAKGAAQPPQGGLGGLMGSQPQRPQPRPQPQGAGLANARMAQAAKQGGPRMMAQGGIVGFAEGKGVSGQAGFGSRALARIEDLGITREQFDAMSADKKQKIVQLINDRNNMASLGNTMAMPGAVIADALSALPISAINAGNYLAETRPGQALGLSDPTQPSAERIPYGGVTSALQNRANTNLSTLVTPAATLNEDQLSRMLPSDMPDVSKIPGTIPGVGTIKSGTEHLPFKQRPPVPGTIPGEIYVPPDQKHLPSKPRPGVPVPPSVAAQAYLDPPPAGLSGPLDDPTTKFPQRRTNDTGGLSSLPAAVDPTAGGTIAAAPSLTGGSDPMVAMKQGIAFGEDQYDVEGKAATKNAQIAEMEALDRELYNPERERRDELTAFLIGAGGTGSIGSTMRGAYSASSAVANKNRAAQRSRLFDKFNIEDARDANDIEMQSNILTLGKTMFSEAAADRRNTENNMTSMTNQKTRALMAKADRDQQRLNDDRTYTQNMRKIDVQEKTANAQEVYNSNVTVGRKLDAILKAESAIAETRASIEATLLADTPIPRLQQDMASTNDTDEQDEIETKIKLAREALRLRVNAQMDLPPVGGEGQSLLDREAALRKQFEDLSGIGSRKPEDVVNVTTNKG